MNELELIEDVGQWSANNFGNNRWPHLGIVEEVGEAVHCVLKRKQGIRGFEDLNFFLTLMADALADATIYLADYCALHGSFFKFNRNQQEGYDQADETRIIIHLLQTSSAVLTHSQSNEFTLAEQQVQNLVCQRLCTGLEIWAKIYTIDLQIATLQTWNKVKERNWKKNPQAPLEHLK